MKTFVASLIALLACAGAAPAVDLVADGKPVAEIICADNATPSAKVAARELQRHLAAISGAKLPISAQVTPDIANHVYVGESDATRALGVALDGVQHDGYRIVARQNTVVLVGRDRHHFAMSYAQYKDVGNRQQVWEQRTGRKWRIPPIIDYRDYNAELNIHLQDATGTLYAVYDLLEQLGMRWYMPVEEIGIVRPQLATVRIKDQDLTREPQFPQRTMIDPALGRFASEFLWFKSMRVGTAEPMPIYHSLSGPLELYRNEQPPEYYGKVNGEIHYFTPRLSNERLRKDLVEYLALVDQQFPGIAYSSIGQPDGWSNIDSDDAAAGWDQFAERGASGRFSNYYWDFGLDIRKRIMEKQPEKKFTIFAYSGTRRPPTNLEKVPENMTVCFCQAAQDWMLPNAEQRDREEWMPKLAHPGQLLIWEYYILHAATYNFPPVPTIFPKLMKQSFDGLYDRSVGFTVELPWSSSEEIARYKRSLRRPGLMHLMLYLHNRLCWDRHLDIPAVLNEYYDLFYGPAKAEMKEFFEFAEAVWMRPEPREITAVGGFLKPADVTRYFEILGRARAKAGDTVYGKRVDFIAAEMEPIKLLFEKLKRTGPKVEAFITDGKPVIDGDLSKPFWRARPYTFTTLRDMTTGELPAHVATHVSFRWLADDSALVVGIECLEPRMNKLRESCKARDSMAIFADDNVEVRLETAQGIRPFIVVSSAGTVYDYCATTNVADLPEWYTVKPVVKKLNDRWMVEVPIDAKTLGAQRPSEFFPWGVHINRQRMAGNTPEYYMLSPSGTNFMDMQCMGNLVYRH